MQRERFHDLVTLGLTRFRDLVTLGLTIPDKLRNSNHDIEGLVTDGQRVGWTAFAILAMFSIILILSPQVHVLNLPIGYKKCGQRCRPPGKLQVESRGTKWEKMAIFSKPNI